MVLDELGGLVATSIDYLLPMITRMIEYICYGFCLNSLWYSIKYIEQLLCCSLEGSMYNNTTLVENEKHIEEIWIEHVIITSEWLTMNRDSQC